MLPGRRSMVMLIGALLLVGSGAVDAVHRAVDHHHPGLPAAAEHGATVAAAHATPPHRPSPHPDDPHHPPADDPPPHHCPLCLSIAQAISEPAAASAPLPAPPIRAIAFATPLPPALLPAPAEAAPRAPPR